MINLEKLNRKSASPPFLRRTAPAPYFQPLFLIFRLPPPGVVIEIYSTSFKKKGEGAGGPNYLFFVSTLYF